MDKDGNTLKCCNHQNDKESIFVDWRLQKEYKQNLYNDCYINRLNAIFDNIAINFYSATILKPLHKQKMKQMHQLMKST